jgi:hypothetical protein
MILSDSIRSAGWARRAWILLGAALLLTIAIYWPGLGGGFVLDDYPNIVENTALHMPDTSAAAWIDAIWASPSSELRRPLASLTFAANYATTGLAPGPMKACNLVLHLLNGLLLFALMRRIVALADSNADATSRALLLPALVAGLWLLHPINLTAVLYVVQRMESLANLFVLAALIVYVDARTSQQVATRARSDIALWVGVPVLTLIGVLAKESAVLVPLYAFILEVTLFRFEGTSRSRRACAAFFIIFLAIPGIVGLSYLLPHYAAPQAYAMRPFTLVERLLTEPRALVDYIGWTLAPLPQNFSLYRDDFPISHGLTDPWTTLPAILAILAIVIAAIALRRRRPLVAIGLGWFIAAHVLTATFVPLELVYEHRNYFASCGLLLAFVDLVLPSTRESALPFARQTVVLALAGLCVFSTALRAREWGNPIRFALLEAARHPASPRATYGLGRTLLIASGYEATSPLIPQARDALERAAAVPSASILPYVALIQLASRTGTPLERGWIDGMTERLGARALTMEDAGALRSLTECVSAGICRIDDSDLLHVYLAAVSHARPDPSALYSYAIFAYQRLHDTELALNLARAAADAPPVDLQYRLNLVNFLISLGRKDEATAELERLRKKQTLGRLSRETADAARRIAALPPSGS